MRHACWLSALALLLAACGTTPVASGTYTVRAGDTLYSIARRYGLEFNQLARLNNLQSSDLIYPGQVLRLSGAARATATMTPAPLLSTLQWRWPTDTGSYTPTTRPNGGVGLLFKGRLGQPIFSAAAGQVLYVGSGLLGYGQLIVIKHDASYLSAYGHLQSIMVAEGAQISAGQRIADMGEGPNSEPLLYFEIRVNGQPIAPLLLLQGQK